MVKDNINLLARIAKCYYIQNLNQKEISEKFNLSKAMVCRLLKEVREKKIITFNLNIPGNERLDLELEELVENTFSLDSAYIYYNENVKLSEKAILDNVVSLGSSYTERILKDNINIAVISSKTLSYVFNRINPDRKYKMNIYSTIGGMNIPDTLFQSNDLLNILNNKVGGKTYPIYQPLIDFSDLPRKEIEYQFKDSEIDYLFTSIGGVSREARYYKLGLLNNEHIEYLKGLNICGEIGFNFYDINGNFIENEIGKKAFKLDYKRIKKMKNKIVIAFGDNKIVALLGALRTKIIDVLITDEITIKKVLKLNKEL
jgi:DNA-binding transcriptional regulator LsrR (DeoR family)